MGGASLATVLKSLFTILGCLITAIIIYALVTDGLPFRKELLTPLMVITRIDIYVNIFIIGWWVVYKESNWTSAVLWVVLLVCLGSVATCVYVVLQLLKLSTQESLQDPIYFVLLRRHRNLMLVTYCYLCVTYGSSFLGDAFTPWMIETTSDFLVNGAVLSVWVAYKESSWLTAAILIIPLNLIGSTITLAYITLQLFNLSSQDPVYLILFNSRNRKENEDMKEPLKQTAWEGVN